MKRFIMTLAVIGIAVTVQAQEDMLAGLVTDPPAKEYVVATFKGTRLINFHTVETLAKGTLEVRISHRFGAISSGSNNFWGLDGPASIQLRLDYALTNRLMIGIGRSSEQKIVDGFVKYKLWRQTTDGSMPVSITGFGSINYNTMPNSLVQDRYQYTNSRISYMASIMVARQFSSKLSIQLSPTYTHFNLVDKLTDKNDLLSIVGSFRYKVSKRSALTLEYMKRLTPYTADAGQYHDVLGVGFDIETGGHVFQVFLTNGSAINEARTIAYTAAGVSDGLMLGFNLSRVFYAPSKH